MVKSIEIKNFKSFKQSANIDLKKINVFVGPNSSGKSSFIQGLLLLKNTINCEMKQLTFGVEGDMLTYTSLLNSDDIDNKIKYGLNLEGEVKKDCVNKQEILSIFPPELVEDVDESIGKYEVIGLNDVSLNLEVLDDITLKINPFKVNTTNNININVYKDNEVYKLSLNDETIDTIEVIYPCNFQIELNNDKLKSINKDDLEKLVLVLVVLQKTVYHLNEFAQNLLYMESSRKDFNRIEALQDIKASETVGSKGQNTLSILLDIINSCDKDDIECIYKKEKINFWLDKFDLGDDIDVSEVDKNRYSINIRNKHLGIYNNILDVGVGTSQLLPIIVESVNSKKRSKIIIEEPETHIHPKAQATLADLFVDSAIRDDKKFIVETHSIFLITQLQILVASGKIDADDVGIYYFTQDSEGSNIMNINILDNGQFEEEWPSGFFDIHYQLGRKLFELM